MLDQLKQRLSPEQNKKLTSMMWREALWMA